MCHAVMYCTVKRTTEKRTTRLSRTMSYVIPECPQVSRAVLSDHAVLYCQTHVSCCNVLSRTVSYVIPECLTSDPLPDVIFPAHNYEARNPRIFSGTSPPPEIPTRNSRNTRV